MTGVEDNFRSVGGMKEPNMYMTIPIYSDDLVGLNNVITFSKYFESFEFKFNELFNEFDLLNPNEIHDFILGNDDLLEYLDQITILLHKYFQGKKFSMEFSLDPELQSLNQLIIYVESDELSFDDDWELLRDFNKEIRHIVEFPSTLKRLLSVDLW